MDTNYVISKDRDWLRPEEYNEAPGECVVAAYWVKNDDCEPNRKMVECPFNSAHRMKQSRLAGHIIKCEKNYPNHRKVRCFYSVLEYIDEDKIDEHLLQCPHRFNYAQTNPAANPSVHVDHAHVQSVLTDWENVDKEITEQEEAALEEKLDRPGVNVVGTLMASIINHNIPDEDDDGDFTSDDSNIMVEHSNPGENNFPIVFEDNMHMDNQINEDDEFNEDVDDLNDWSRPSSINGDRLLDMLDYLDDEESDLESEDDCLTVEPSLHQPNQHSAVRPEDDCLTVEPSLPQPNQHSAARPNQDDKNNSYSVDKPNIPDGSESYHGNNSYSVAKHNALDDNNSYSVAKPNVPDENSSYSVIKPNVPDENSSYSVIKPNVPAGKEANCQSVPEHQEHSESDRTKDWVSNLQEGPSDYNEHYKSADFSKRHPAVQLDEHRTKHTEMSTTRGRGQLLTHLMSTVHTGDKRPGASRDKVDILSQVQSNKENAEVDHIGNILGRMMVENVNSEDREAAESAQVTKNTSSTFTSSVSGSLVTESPHSDTTGPCVDGKACDNRPLRRQLSLSDLVVFSDDTAPDMYFVSSEDGLRTPHPVEDEDRSQVVCRSGRQDDYEKTYDDQYTSNHYKDLRRGDHYTDNDQPKQYRDESYDYMSGNGNYKNSGAHYGSLYGNEYSHPASGYSSNIEGIWTCDNEVSGRGRSLQLQSNRKRDELSANVKGRGSPMRNFTPTMSPGSRTNTSPYNRSFTHSVENPEPVRMGRGPYLENSKPVPMGRGQYLQQLKLKQTQVPGFARMRPSSNLNGAPSHSAGRGGCQSSPRYNEPSCGYTGDEPQSSRNNGASDHLRNSGPNSNNGFKKAPSCGAGRGEPFFPTSNRFHSISSPGIGQSSRRHHAKPNQTVYSKDKRSASIDFKDLRGTPVTSVSGYPDPDVPVSNNRQKPKFDCYYIENPVAMEIDSPYGMGRNQPMFPSQPMFPRNTNVPSQNYGRKNSGQTGNFNGEICPSPRGRGEMLRNLLERNRNSKQPGNIPNQSKVQQHFHVPQGVTGHAVSPQKAFGRGGKMQEFRLP